MWYIGFSSVCAHDINHFNWQVSDFVVFLKTLQGIIEDVVIVWNMPSLLSNELLAFAEILVVVP